jgi:hypothetical protein
MTARALGGMCLGLSRPRHTPFPMEGVFSVAPSLGLAYLPLALW